ncbi:unnamed protein product [Brassicogethes aeneus]|uniref:Arf-GAP domain-containing protein n=1 Tax=Brassicogethes aeneus TaxID=1431903 RepID=A0A9P0BF14_BRAAE|nr:unnamed protein product [Brassicogethes aeneus]
MESQPSKSDIESVFHRLRAIPANKQCFDCYAKNPSWSSVTYGVFICLDCSAVHRSLGVHLTFVRSTLLDTNWTWVQLRQMQLGGNSNAQQFFQQHNCETSDAQKKYNSRAAQLYKEKLSHAALHSLKTNKDLHIHPNYEEKNDNAEKEIDFFSEHEKFISPEMPDLPEQHLSKPTTQNPPLNPGEGPKVDFGGTGSEPRKSTITARKAPAKKSGLGAKKSGLGATKVKTNFADLEREAEMAEQSRLRAREESALSAELSAKEQEERDAAVRLAYKDLSKEVHKREVEMRKQDPKKADQAERLGMGNSSRAGVSHSALSDMHMIQQEQEPRTLSSLGKLRVLDNDTFFDDCGGFSSMYMNPPSASSNDTFDLLNKISNLEKTKQKLESAINQKEKDSWVIVDDPPEKPSSSSNYTKSYDKPKVVDKSPMGGGGETAQRKFGNAKAISSEQYFNNQETDYETKANLNRFQGSSSISSADFFGNGNESSQSQSYSNNLQQYDLDDVKESVRQGVTKVAGKIGSLANGFMSSLQDRYGY